MKIRIQSRDQLVAQFGYLDDEGKPSKLAIANLLRTPLSRWGLSPKRAVLDHARIELRACGIEDVSGIQRVLDRLVDLGECAEVNVGHETILAPATPRWISVGNSVSTYLGVSEPPDGLEAIENSHNDIVRRLRVDADEGSAILQLAGVREQSLLEWLTPLGYFRHITRRKQEPVRSDHYTLGQFWELLEKAIDEEGLPLDCDSDVRFLAGRPGTFFGRYYSSQPQGRWTTDPGQGLWCAYRRGYGEAHWHPCIVAITGENRRLLDLYNEDEWQWAVLARGRSVGNEEVVQSDGLTVRLTFPVPRQLRAAMDILGRPKGVWTWEVSPGGPDLRKLLN